MARQFQSSVRCGASLDISRRYVFGAYEPIEDLRLSMKTKPDEGRKMPYDVVDADEVQNETQSPVARHIAASGAFWGFLTTQFLGAFNDNYVKQMVLLTCAGNVAVVAGKTAANPDRQSLAMAAFALPFVFMSGLGGFLSDRCSKQRVIVGCKLAEILIMAIAMAATVFLYR